MQQILLIDDAATDNFLHARILRKAYPGCTIHTAADGAAALQLLPELCTRGLDLILLDINMPTMDGWEFLERYERLATEQRAKCLLMMVSVMLPSSDEARVEASEAIAGTVFKPLDANAIATLYDQNTVV